MDSLVENFLRVSSNTSDVNHPSCRLSRNVFVLSRATPMASAVSYKAFLNSSPPIPALTTEFQSIRLTLPEANAWDNWYIAVDACIELEPDAAAKLEIPLIASAESSRPTPAAVKVPIFRVISSNEYIVLSAYSLRSDNVLLIWII